MGGQESTKEIEKDVLFGHEDIKLEVAPQAEVNQPTQPTGRPVVTEQTSRSSAQEIDTRFSLDCEKTNLFVERSEKDDDADGNVDADQTKTVRHVSGQPTGLFT